MGERHQRLGSDESENFPRPSPDIGASGEAENRPVEGCLTDPASGETDSCSRAVLLSFC
jgi:hypothetical protein